MVTTKRKMFKDYKPVELTEEQIKELQDSFPKIKKAGVRMEGQNIVRKDGIEYTRKRKDVNYGCKVNLRLSITCRDKLKEIANEKGITFTELVRELLENYIINN